MGFIKGLGLMALATSLVILATAVKSLVELNIDTLIKGLSSIAMVLTEVGLFITLTGDSTKVMTTALGLIALGAAMLIFSKAIGSMGSMSLETIGKGLLTMAGALTIIGLALMLMPINMPITGAGLVIVAASL